MKIINYKYFIAILLFTGIIIAACDSQNEVKHINFETPSVMTQIRAKQLKKWTKEYELQQKQDEDDATFKARAEKMFDKYHEDLRKYKKSKHKIVYGWFGGWSATPGIKKSFLSNLPDSVDIVSIWGGIPAFGKDDPKWADLKYAQEVKGLKVLLCWQTGSSGLGLPGGTEAFNKRHKGKTSVEKAKAYAIELTKFIKEHNLNGYDIDWEPTVGNHDHNSCLNLYHNCEDNTNDTAPINAFIEEMGKHFGPQKTIEYDPRGTGTLFLFDGELKDMASRFPEKGKYFNYFLEQNYRSRNAGHEYGAAVNKITGFTNEKYIMCDEFEMNFQAGGVCGGENGKACCELKAENVKKYGYGGWGAYHIELEEAQDYRLVKSVIQIMNPTTYPNIKK